MNKKISIALVSILSFVGLFGITNADDVEYTSEYKELKNEFLNDLKNGEVTNIENRLKSYLTELESLLKDYTVDSEARVKELLIRAESLTELFDDYEDNFSKKTEDIIEAYDKALGRLESYYKKGIQKGSDISQKIEKEFNDIDYKALKNNYKKIFETKLGDTLDRLSDDKIREVIKRIGEMEGKYKSMNISAKLKQSYGIQLGVLRDMLKERLAVPTTDDLIDLEELFK